MNTGAQVLRLRKINMTCQDAFNDNAQFGNVAVRGLQHREGRLLASSCLSVCLSVRVEHLRLPLDGFLMTLDI